MQKKNLTLLRNITLCSFFVAAFVMAPSANLSAQTTDDLIKKIEETKRKKADLEKEIEILNNQITQTNQEAKSLQSTVKQLDQTKAKISTDIRATKTKITYADLALQKLALDIEEKENKIEVSKKAVAETIKRINETDSVSMIEALLTYKGISEFWDGFENLQRVQTRLRTEVETLTGVRTSLETDKQETELQKVNLVEFEDELRDKQQLVQINQQEKNKLLSQTKAKESEYKKLLEDRLAKKQAFEQELFSFESELKLKIDPNSVPASGEKVLTWPVQPVRITQEFGDTAFSRANALVYSGKGHNGIDFGIPEGTAVKAAAGGVIEGAGDTDTVCPKASYGKWVLIKHNNGLSTLYAHFSLIKVSAGQTVKTGDIIGYSGNTGYSTGPHLHFTVYASQGVQILSRKSAVCGGTYVMPIADLKAYLNPLLYL